MMKKIVFTILCCAFLQACSEKYTEIPQSELKGAFIVNSSPTFEGYFYEGSDEEFHYFVSRWKVEGDRHFKIATDHLDVANEQPSGEASLRLFLFQPEGKTYQAFSKIESGPQLYFEK